MTIQQALDRKSIVDKDSFPPELKIPWLSELDAQLFIEVIQTHENPDNVTFKPYTPEDAGKPLLVPFPYDKLYIPYLMARAAEAYGEIDDFNNHNAVYEKFLREFKGYWNKKYRPILPGTRTVKPGGIVYVYPTENPLERKV